MKVNQQGYLEKKVNSGKGVKSWRNWWLVTHSYHPKLTCSNAIHISLPKEYVGKRIHIKIELIND